MRRSSRRAQSSSFDVPSYQDFLEKGTDSAGFKRRYIGEYIGWGVFATKKHLKGSFLLMYHGVLIKEDEARRREKSYDKTKKGSFMFYFKHNTSTLCVDATKDDGTLGRLVNDAWRGAANCSMKKVSTEKGSPALCLFANRDIEIGEELRYDYGVDDLPWRQQKNAATRSFPELDVKQIDKSDAVQRPVGEIRTTPPDEMDNEINPGTSVAITTSEVLHLEKHEHGTKESDEGETKESRKNLVMDDFHHQMCAENAKVRNTSLCMKKCAKESSADMSGPSESSNCKHMKRKGKYAGEDVANKKKRGTNADIRHANGTKTMEKQCKKVKPPPSQITSTKHEGSYSVIKNLNRDHAATLEKQEIHSPRTPDLSVQPQKNICPFIEKKEHYSGTTAATVHIISGSRELLPIKDAGEQVASKGQYSKRICLDSSKLAEAGNCKLTKRTGKRKKVKPPPSQITSTKHEGSYSVIKNLNRDHAATLEKQEIHSPRTPDLSVQPQKNICPFIEKKEHYSGTTAATVHIISGSRELLPIKDAGEQVASKGQYSKRICLDSSKLAEAGNCKLTKRTGKRSKLEQNTAVGPSSVHERALLPKHSSRPDQAQIPLTPVLKKKEDASGTTKAYVRTTEVSIASERTIVVQPKKCKKVKPPPFQTTSTKEDGSCSALIETKRKGGARLEKEEIIQPPRTPEKGKLMTTGARMISATSDSPKKSSKLEQNTAVGPSSVHERALLPKHPSRPDQAQMPLTPVLKKKEDASGTTKAHVRTTEVSIASERTIVVQPKKCKKVKPLAFQKTSTKEDGPRSTVIKTKIKDNVRLEKEEIIQSPRTPEKRKLMTTGARVISVTSDFPKKSKKVKPPPFQTTSTKEDGPRSTVIKMKLKDGARPEKEDIFQSSRTPEKRNPMTTGARVISATSDSPKKSKKVKPPPFQTTSTKEDGSCSALIKTKRKGGARLEKEEIIQSPRTPEKRKLMTTGARMISATGDSPTKSMNAKLPKRLDGATKGNASGMRNATTVHMTKVHTSHYYMAPEISAVVQPTLMKCTDIKPSLTTQGNTDFKNQNNNVKSCSAQDIALLQKKRKASAQAQRPNAPKKRKEVPESTENSANIRTHQVPISPEMSADVQHKKKYAKVKVASKGQCSKGISADASRPAETGKSMRTKRSKKYAEQDVESKKGRINESRNTHQSKRTDKTEKQFDALMQPRVVNLLGSVTDGSTIDDVGSQQQMKEMDSRQQMTYHFEETAEKVYAVMQPVVVDLCRSSDGSSLETDVIYPIVTSTHAKRQCGSEDCTIDCPIITSTPAKGQCGSNEFTIDTTANKAFCNQDESSRLMACILEETTEKDTYTCGGCKRTFNDLDRFIAHKHTLCRGDSKNVPSIVLKEEKSADEGTRQPTQENTHLLSWVERSQPDGQEGMTNLQLFVGRGQPDGQERTEKKGHTTASGGDCHDDGDFVCMRSFQLQVSFEDEDDSIIGQTEHESNEGRILQELTDENADRHSTKGAGGLVQEPTEEDADKKSTVGSLVQEPTKEDSDRQSIEASLVHESTDGDAEQQSTDGSKDGSLVQESTDGDDDRQSTEGSKDGSLVQESTDGDDDQQSTDGSKDGSLVQESTDGDAEQQSTEGSTDGSLVQESTDGDDDQQSTDGSKDGSLVQESTDGDAEQQSTEGSTDGSLVQESTDGDDDQQSTEGSTDGSLRGQKMGF
ncbi:uncharacterized protein LOC135503564 [Lineus longissimus]|uniref:uncharacterized protein LOC135503564 n=1 Tax=Lineus longissimus TaxID=88925 RepID=UPI00315DF736